MSPDKFAPYRLLSGGAQSPRLHRRLDVYMSTWLLLHSLVSLLDMNISVYFSTLTIVYGLGYEVAGGYCECCW